MIFIVALLIHPEIARQIQHTSDIMCIARIDSRSSTKEPDHFEAWAYRILVKACYAEASRNRRWTSTVRILPMDRASDADEIGSISDRDELEQAFRRLPLDQRAVFVLHHHACMPLVAVADALGIPNGTARSRLHHATSALRTAFVASRERDRLRDGRPA